MAKQVIIGRTNSSATNDLVNQPLCITDWQANGNVARVACTVMAACTVTSIYVKCAAAPGSGKSYTYTLHKNGSATTLTFSISDLATEGSDIAHPITFAAGDTIHLHRASSGAPTASIMTVITQIDSTALADSVYGYTNWNTGNGSAANRYNGIFTGRPSQWSTTQTDYQNIVAAAGNLTGYAVRLHQAPGAGTSFGYAIYKNGTKQDGTGGTVDTRLTVADAATSGSVNFTLPLAAGDRVELECDPTGATNTCFTTVGAAFTATVSGQAQYCCIRDGGPVTLVATSYGFPYGYTTTTDTTEANVAVPAVFVPFQLSGLQIRQSTNSGTAKSFQYKGRLNLDDPQHQLDVTISGNTDVTGSDTNPSHRILVTSASDTFDLQVIPSGTPNNAEIWFSMIQSPPTQGAGGKGKGKSGGGVTQFIPSGAACYTIGNPSVDNETGG